MPLYAYTCDACHTEFERRQSFQEETIRVCPDCGEPSARRLITPVGVIFKGSGFYVTDNRDATNGSTTSDRGKDTAEEKDSAKSTSSKAEEGDSSTT